MKPREPFHPTEEQLAVGDIAFLRTLLASRGWTEALDALDRIVDRGEAARASG